MPYCTRFNLFSVEGSPEGTQPGEPNRPSTPEIPPPLEPRPSTPVPGDPPYDPPMHDPPPTQPAPNPSTPMEPEMARWGFVSPSPLEVGHNEVGHNKVESHWRAAV
jgi:hypothetical protein